MKALHTQDIYFSCDNKAFVLKRCDDTGFTLTVNFISEAVKAFILRGFQIISYEEAVDFQQKYLIFKKEVESRDKIFISSKSSFYVLSKDKDKIHNPYIFFEIGSEFLGHSGYHSSASEALMTALSCPGVKIVSYADTLK